MTGRRKRLTLLYDGECRLCLQSVEIIRRMKTDADIRMLPLQEAAAEELPAGVGSEQLLAELHVLDGEGRLHRGAEALVRIIQTVPAWRWLAVLYRVPGLKRLADWGYRFIAKHRYRLFGKAGPHTCGSGACRLPSRQQPSASRKEKEPQ